MAPRNGTAWTPTSKQKAVLLAAMEVGLNRTITAVCLEARIDRKSFYRWLKDKQFRDAWEQAWHGNIQHHLPGVISAQLEKALAGDTAAARLVADLAGVLKIKAEVSAPEDQPWWVDSQSLTAQFALRRRVVFWLTDVKRRAELEASESSDRETP